MLFGKDVVADLEVPMNLHRVEVEHELRQLLLKLRQHVLHAGRNEMEFNAVMKRTISSAVTLLRHTLLAFGEEPPLATQTELFSRIETATGADASAFAELYAYRETGALRRGSVQSVRQLHARAGKSDYCSG